MANADLHNTAPTSTAPRKARMTGLAVAGAGIVIFNISPFLAWVSRPEENEQRTNISGYETDSLVPFIAYLGIGLLVAMIYAGKRAYRGQHRGLTLVSMAVALAAVLQCLAFAIDPMGDLERGYDLHIKIGVFVGLIGAIVWSIGSGLLAKEVEGDDDHDHDDARARRSH